MAYKEYELCIKPESNLTIWRYMSLEKFELLLKNQSLFFCKADRFSDPYEGSIPKEEAEYRIEDRKKISASFNKKFNRQKAQENIDALSKLHISFKQQHIINCWHINNSENDSMWQLYLKSNEGVAIKTSVERLLHSFSCTDEKIYCSKIRYLDYDKDIWYDKLKYPIRKYNMFIPFVHKRIEFRQEEELRLIYKIEDFDDYNNYWEQQPIQNGTNIKVDINHLIEEIYCPPTSDKNQIEKINNILFKYNFDFKVQKSKLSKEPYF